MQYKKPIIGIRAGHGGIDPITKKYTTPTDKGKFKIFPATLEINLHEKLPDGRKVFYEGVWNRMIADKLAYELDMTYKIPTVKFHHDYLDIGLIPQCDLINQVNASFPIALLFELHSNAFNGLIKGFEIFTSKGQTKSDKYAEQVWKLVTEEIPELVLRSDKSDGDHDKEDKLKMTSDTDCPTILSECGFFDNIEDIKTIMNPRIINLYVSILATVAYNAYHDYLVENKMTITTTFE